MFSSTIIPTIGRDSLDRAVTSVLDQELDQDGFEVIVVNDSGQPLATAAWQASPQVRILETQKRERCFARNAGAAVARGRLLHFLDDDDWLLPGALQAIWALSRRAPDAVWLYGGIGIVDNRGKRLAELNAALAGNCAAHFVGGAWAPIQVSWVREDAFFAVGGFDPHLLVTQDLDLCRRLAMQGKLANTSLVLGCLRRDLDWGSSTRYQLGPSLNRQARSAILSEPGAWRRLMASTNDCYWLGRVVRVYFSALMLHGRRREAWTALSRTLYLLLTVVWSARCLTRPHFWQAIRAEHVPGTLFFVLAELESSRR